ncbi:MAG: sialidase family protein [Gammaproteobacteria bacterium]
MFTRHYAFFLIMALAIQGCAEAPVETAHRQPGGEIQKPLSSDCGDPANMPSNVCSRTIGASFDRHGTLWIAWEQNGRVYIQKSSDKGKSFSSPVQVTSEPEAVIAHDEYRPKVKVGPEGTVFVSWVMSLEKRHSGHVRFSRSTDGGKTFSEPVTVNTNQDMIGHRFDDMLIGPGGKIAIFWLDARDAEAAKAKNLEYDGSSMYYSWSDDDGEHFFEDAKVTGNTCQCCRIDSDTDQDGLPVVMWRHVFPGSVRDHALLKFKSWNEPGGDIVRVSFDQWEIDACPHHGPGFAIDRQGRYHAVWFDNAENAQGLFYAFSNDRGRHFSKHVNFGDRTKAASHPDVGVLNQTVVIAWTEYDGKQNKLQAMQSTDGGVNWTPPQTIGVSESESDNAFVINDGAGLYVSWHNRLKGYRIFNVTGKL